VFIVPKDVGHCTFEVAQVVRAALADELAVADISGTRGPAVRGFRRNSELFQLIATADQVLGGGPAGSMTRGRDCSYPS
jgi:hypothetical protein